jgi:LysR family glycine cleavage system transcriptional activator
VITALHSFTSRWLLPRLGRFMEESEIQVFLVPTTELVDFDKEGVDLGIRFGGGHYPGLHSILLAPDHAFPVYNPATLKSRGPIETPADLLKQRLLIDDSPMEMSWKQWFEQAGVGTVDVRPAAMIADSSMLVDAAVRGQGVALVRESLVTEELAAGRLVVPFDIRLPLNFSYYLVVPEGKRELPKVRLFVDWLMGEMKSEG